jgi:hypothetical protein
MGGGSEIWKRGVGGDQRYGREGGGDQRYGREGWGVRSKIWWGEGKDVGTVEEGEDKKLRTGESRDKKYKDIGKLGEETVKILGGRG